MTTIRTTCGQCGDVELTTRDVSLELAGNGDEGTYRFVCPTCLSIQRRPATKRVVSILLATGVAYEITVERAVITEKEISHFVSKLDRDDWFNELVASGS